jgi:hypothetical protein
MPGNNKERMHRGVAKAVFEKAFGKQLPQTAEVHHVDGTRSEYSPLVICENHAYHMLLHRRMRVVRAGGNPNTDKVCSQCGHVLPLSSFRRDSSQCDGRKKTCYLCRRLIRKDGYHKQKMTPAEIRATPGNGLN